MSVAGTIAKNTLFNLITHSSEQIITFGIGVLLARYLGPEDYGLYAFLVWFLLLGVYFTNLGLGYMVTRFIAESLGQQNVYEAHNYVRLALWLRIIAAIVVTMVIILFAGYWADVFGHPGNKLLFIILSFGVLPYVLTFLLTSIFAGFQKYEYGAYLTLCMNPLRLIGVIIVVVMDCGVKEILLVNIASWVVGAFIGLFLLRRLVSLKSVFTLPHRNTELRRAAKYSIIVTGVFLVNYFLRQRAEILFLGIFYPGEAVGFYTIAFLVPTATAGLMLMVFSQVLVPAVSEQFGRGDIDRIREIYITAARYLMMLGLPLAIGGIILSEPIITVIYGVDYSPVIPIMRILFVPIAVIGIAEAAVSVIYGINQPSFVLKVGVGLVILNIGLNLWLIPTYGVIGAAIGSSVPRLIAPLFYIRFASRQCQAAWPITDTLRIITASFIMGAIVFVLQYYIRTPIISLVLLIPLGFIIQAISLLILGVVRDNDVNTFKRMQHSLPTSLHGIYSILIRLVEAWLKWRNKSDTVE